MLLRLCCLLCLIAEAFSGRLGLHKAAQEGQLEPLKVAIAGRYDEEEAEWKKPDVNKANKKGQVALHMAVCNKRDDPEVVRVLLDKGKADANKRDANGETALHVVVRMCDHLPTPVEMATAVSMAKVLLAHGADPSSARVVAGEDVTSFTPLHVAAERGHYKLVELLVRRGADVNAADSAGATPLHYASRALKAKIVHALIAGGANVDVADAAGHKASDLEAVKNGKDSFAKAIREHFDRSRQIRTTALEENKKKKGKAKASLKAGGQKSEL